MRRLSKWTERVDYTRVMDASQATRVNDRYVDNLYVCTSSLRRGISITSKATSTLGYSMEFVLLNLMTQSEA